MALQDVCNFQDTPAYSNSSALFLTTERNTSLNFEKRTACSFGFSDISLGKRNSGIPIEFYVPVPDYLTQSPIQFGQVVPSSLPINSALIQSPSFLSPSCLPASFPLSSNTSVSLPFPLSHGTTTLAFAFQGGAIAAADTRSSCGGLVACPASHKVLPVHSHLVGTTSGTSADCALWKRILARECRLYQLRNRRRLTVGGTAKLLSHMLHPFKGTELCVAATLCGWDGEDEDDGTAELEMTRSGWGPGDTTFGQTEMDDGTCGQERALEQVFLKYGDKSRETECQKTKKDEREIEQMEPLSRDERVKLIDTSQMEKESSVRNIERKPETIQLRKVKMIYEREGDQDDASSLSSKKTNSGTAKVRAVGWAPGPRLCYVCSDGTLLKGKVFSVGSGSPYAYSVLDMGLQWGLSVAEACLLAREAVFRATHRDAYSGNCVDLFHITSRGWRQRKREDLKEEYYREKEKMKKIVDESRRNRHRQK